MDGLDSLYGKPLSDMASLRSSKLNDSTTLSSIRSSPSSSQNRKYGADDDTQPPIEFEDTFQKRTSQGVEFEDAFRSQPIGFDRRFGLTCIVLHESLHSAAFYVLIPGVLYMKEGGPLKYSDNQAAVIILVFTGLAFLLPLIGGIIGDTVLGRYKAILFGTVIEFFGMVILLIYAVLVYAGATGIGPELSVPVANFLFVTALILIALGMGFIKANVTTFGAGQLYDTSDSAQKIHSYFRWYIFSINLGKLLAFCPISLFLLNYAPAMPSNATTANLTANMSLISSAVPIEELRHNELLAVGASILQVVFVGVAIFVFIVGKAKYKMIEPSGGQHISYVFCFNQGKEILYEREHQEYHHEMIIYKRIVFRLTILMAALFAMYTIYEAVIFQMVSIFMLQFKELSQPAGSLHLPLTFMNTFSTLVLIVCVPFLECFSKRRLSAKDVTEEEIDAAIAQWARESENGSTNPSAAETPNSITKLFGTPKRGFVSLSRRYNTEELNEDVRRRIAEDIALTIRRRDILVRMVIGLGLAALCILYAGILESVRKNYVGLGIENQPSVFWQVPQYIIMGFGEMLGGISAYEFASMESLPGLQGFTIGMFISTYGLGSLFALLCYAGLSGSVMYPKDLNEINMEYVWFGHFGFLLLITLAFITLARQYHQEHPGRLEEPKRPYGADDDDDKF
ncbi:uncharacterized protein LOC135487028 [Lineus longissimus]|uniref:uncharacterized protein LOC135487028 n=1 Tax=Lineus longissimus TaxID=88925 RepID=UPI002B4D051E